MGQYIRLEVVPIDMLVPLIHAHWHRPKTRVVLAGGHSVGVSSVRMKTFGRAAISKDGIKCKGCGMKAAFFAVENFRGSNQSVPHANLYGVDREGNEVLFTHDHKLARSLGGADNLNNTQVMCSPCNTKKSIVEQGRLEKKKQLDNLAQKQEAS